VRAEADHVGSDRNEVQGESGKAETRSCRYLLECVQGLDKVPLEALPDLLGDLERLRAKAWARMVTPSRTGTEEAFEERPAPLMTASEVAAHLRFSRGHVYELSRSGKLPTVRSGRAIRFRRDDIEAWKTHSQTGGVDSSLLSNASSGLPRAGRSAPSRSIEGFEQNRKARRRTERKEHS
jgi:excisionase family DNA binding protein